MSYALELSKKFELNINKKIKELSTGYSSICKLINTMASGAEILIFDEPVLGLDANHREMFYKELMESYKLAKYNVKSNLKPIIIFYLIFIALITALGMVGGDTTGLEFSSVIFLFVIGLNSFKENFYFSQANNISREDFFKSMAVTILPVALGMSIIDLVINRTYNLFVASPTIYDMAYGSRPYFLINVETWTQSNSIQTLFGTVTFLFASYIVVFAIGLLITIIYYKCNKTMKILVTLSPLFFQAILGIIVYFSPQFEGKLEVFIEDILGINTRNSYMAVMTFICLFIILMFFVYILVRKAVVKRV